MRPKSEEGHRRRLRRDFLTGEGMAREDAGILELILTFAIPSADVSLLAGSLLARFGSLAGVLQVDFDTLCRIDGVKAYTATLLKLIHWLRKPSLEGSTTPFQVGQGELFSSLSETGLQKAEELSGGKGRKWSAASKGPVLESAARTPPGLFRRSLLRETVEIASLLPQTDSIEGIKDFLQSHLQANSPETRTRYAHTIARSLFPAGAPDRALLQFAHHFSGRQELRDACFLRFLKAQPLMRETSLDVFLPVFPNGSLTRYRLWSYLEERFPGAKGVKECTLAIVETLVAAGLATTDVKEVKLIPHPLLLPSLAFLLHEEFPTPGSYPIAQLAENPTLRVMLWPPQEIRPALLALQSQGLLADSGEVETGDQFTTQFTQEEAVEKLSA
ncbi:MAG: hypothetical protein NTV33_03620 [Coprothermobacterota bacterium]|nr:hypothetical protein [Coprothermobacterota bacterium]